MDVNGLMNFKVPYENRTGVCICRMNTYRDNNRIDTENGVAYTYDNNGNLLGDGKNTYSYDEANHLSQVYDTLNDITYGYVYDGLGDLIQSTTGAETTAYVLDLAGSLS